PARSRVPAPLRQPPSPLRIRAWRNPFCCPWKSFPLPQRFFPVPEFPPADCAAAVSAFSNRGFFLFANPSCFSAVVALMDEKVAYLLTGSALSSRIYRHHRCRVPGAGSRAVRRLLSNRPPPGPRHHVDFESELENPSA